MLPPQPQPSGGGSAAQAATASAPRARHSRSHIENIPYTVSGGMKSKCNHRQQSYCSVQAYRAGVLAANAIAPHWSVLGRAQRDRGQAPGATPLDKVALHLLGPSRTNPRRVRDYSIHVVGCAHAMRAAHQRNAESKLRIVSTAGTRALRLTVMDAQPHHTNMSATAPNGTSPESRRLSHARQNKTLKSTRKVIGVVMSRPR